MRLRKSASVKASSSGSGPNAAKSSSASPAPSTLPASSRRYRPIRPNLRGSRMRSSLPSSRTKRKWTCLSAGVLRRNDVEIAGHLDLDGEHGLVAYRLRALLAGQRDDDPLRAPIDRQDLAAADVLDELLWRRVLDLARPVEPGIERSFGPRAAVAGRARSSLLQVAPAWVAPSLCGVAVGSGLLKALAIDRSVIYRSVTYD